MAGPDAAATARAPGLWLYLPGAKIVRASDAMGADTSSALYFTFEGGREWLPVAKLADELKARGA